MPTVDSRDVAIHYEAYGDGSPVLFIHGAGGNSAIWWQQVPAFVAAGHRVLVYDVRGFGRSICSAEQFSPEHFPGDVAAVLDAEGIERSAIVAQALGGWTGLATALAMPERVSALVLGGTPGGLRTDEVEAAFASFDARVQAGRVSTLPSDNFLGPDFRIANPNHTHLYNAIGALNPPFDFARTAGVVQQRFSIDDYRSTGIPLLVVGGEDDPLWPPAALRSVAAAVPGAELEIVDGVGHSPYYEVPDHFNERTIEFLRRH